MVAFKDIFIDSENIQQCRLFEVIFRHENDFTLTISTDYSIKRFFRAGISSVSNIKRPTGPIYFSRGTLLSNCSKNSKIQLTEFIKKSSNLKGVFFLVNAHVVR